MQLSLEYLMLLSVFTKSPTKGIPVSIAVHNLGLDELGFTILESTLNWFTWRHSCSPKSILHIVARDLLIRRRRLTSDQKS